MVVDSGLFSPLNNTTLLATQNPIAYISISMTNSLDHSPDGRLFYIGGFYVRPEYRGKGIGKKLFDYAVKKANGDNIALNGGEGKLERVSCSYQFDEDVHKERIRSL